MDLKILNLMLGKPSIAQKEIAKLLKLTPPAVTNRVKKMKSAGIIKGSMPVFNLQELGFGITVLASLNVKSENLAETAAWFAKDKNVCTVYYIRGVCDILVIAKFKNTTEFGEWYNHANAFVREHLTDRMNPSLVFNIVKEGLTPSKLS